MLTHKLAITNQINGGFSMYKKLIKSIYLILAFIFLVIGAIGIVLPVLPTTPFLLVASYCFARASSRFHSWFISTKLYKNHLHNFVETRSMTLKTKWTILLPASSMLILVYILCPIEHARYLIVAVAVFKYYYFFFRIKTIRNQKLA